MNKNESSKIEISLKDFPDNLTSLIKESWDPKHSVKKLAARSTLLGMGKPAPVEVSEAIKTMSKRKITI